MRIKQPGVRDKKLWRKQASSAPISAKAAQLLLWLDTNRGNDAAAMAQAQRLFTQLAGERCTETLIVPLEDFLRIKEWGVRCAKDGCGEPAVLSWRRSDHHAEGGVARYSHGGLNRRYAPHGCDIVLPLLTLVQSPLRPRKKTHSIPMSAKAVSLLRKLTVIKGNDDKAMKEAQEVFTQLAGEHCTEALISTLKLFLKERAWGVRCLQQGCGEPAALVWVWRKGYTAGGCMRYQHPDSNGIYTIHGGATTLPLLKLVERPRHLPKTKKNK